METKAYACFNKNRTDRASSSSGGVYILLAKKIMQQGSVFAVCYDENLETFHKELTTQEDLEASQGSKYVPSRLVDTFERVKILLSEGKKVLFVGTPCQCAGLLGYVGELSDNLFTVDFICHGTPSRVAWRRFLEAKSTDKRLISVNMRDKSLGWSKQNYNWKIKYDDGTEALYPQRTVSYMKGFINDFYLRPSCYECRFKGTERQTDITLGDYWGVWDIQPEMDDGNGTSLVLIHSEKGNFLFDSISSDLVLQEADLESAVERNLSIISSAKYVEKRTAFFNKMIKGVNFDKTVEYLLKPPLQTRAKRKVMNVMNSLKMGGIK